MAKQDSGQIFKNAVFEVAQHVQRGGWEQPVRLFALAESNAIIAEQPDLASELQIQPDTLTSVEQEGFDGHASVDSILATIAWPPEVIGAVITMERLVLPPAAEAGLPEDAEASIAAARTHPDRQDVRMVIGVMRDGARQEFLQLRSSPEQWITAGHDEQLVPQVVSGLLATFD